VVATELDFVVPSHDSVRLFFSSTCWLLKTQAADLDGALAHMATKHGFFLPDVEYLSDLEGLLGYLHQKVDSRTRTFC
jgi:pre-60S factor REI1